MPDLSLRYYLQMKGAGPDQGVRWCAPALALRKISLRALLRGINRRILHLSDLHIGLNNDAIPAAQVQKIIDAIKRIYPKQDESYENPRPIVVITGDLVDYYSPAHLDTAFDLLQQLTLEGFTVLVIPGNHDYSDSFSTDSFMPLLESLPITGDLIKFVARLVEDHISKGQDPNLVSGLTFSSLAASDFKAKMAPYLGQNSSYHPDSWKHKGAIFDLDFILLDGQDKEANRPDWDDPRRLVREKVHDAVQGFEGIPIGVNKDTLADTIANAVANLSLDPMTIYATTYQTVVVIEESVYQTAYAIAFAALSAAALTDPAAAAMITSLLVAAHPIIELLDLGLAATVASAAVAAVSAPLLDDKFFLHNGDFRLAHGYLDSEGLQFFKDRVAKDVASNTLPIACIHYWLNYPDMDTRFNNNSDNPTHSLTNEIDLFGTLDKCHMLLVGHIHKPDDGTRYTFQKSNQSDKLSYYSRAGSTVPSPKDWNNSIELKDHQSWLEITINLNTKDVYAEIKRVP